MTFVPHLIPGPEYWKARKEHMEASSATPETPRVPIYGITRYETKVVGINLGEEVDTEEKELVALEELLNEYGQEGYQLVTVGAGDEDYELVAIFQRPTVERVG